MNKKLQSSLEFVIMLSFLMLFFSVFILIVQGNMSSKLQEKQAALVKETAVEIQDEINLALEASDGYQREFEVPEMIGNLDYDVNIIEEKVFINTTNGKYSIALPVPKVTGNLQKGTNKIQKQNSEILLNQ